MLSQTYERPLTLFDIFGAVFRYKWRVLLVSLCALAVSVTAVFLFPKKYESEAKLFVRLGRGSASLDPAAMGQTIAIQESRETEMNSISDMLHSRSLAESVVADIGPEALLQKHAWFELKLEEVSDLVSEQLERLTASSDEDAITTVREVDTVSPSQIEQTELAIKEFQSNLHVDSPKKSTTIGIAFRARDPELAKRVVEAVIKSYQIMHIAAYQSMGTLEFFDQQFAEQAELLAAAEDALRLEKNKHSIVTVRGEQDSLQSEITDVKKMKLQTQAELEGSRAKVQQLETEIDHLDAEIVAQKTSGIASNATDSMRNSLYALEIEEKDLASKYTEADPRLLRVREQLRTAREIVDAQPTEVPQSVLAVNPVRQQMQNELLIAKSGLAALHAKSHALEQLELELIDRLNQLNDLEISSEAMQRQIETGRENYRSYAKKLEESRVNAALDAQSLSNVSVVGAPTIQYKHVSPKRSVLLVLGGLASLLCGVAVALVSDYRRTAKELSVIRQAEREAYLRQLQFAQPPNGSVLEELQLSEPKHLMHPQAKNGHSAKHSGQVAESLSGSRQLAAADATRGSRGELQADVPKRAK